MRSRLFNGALAALVVAALSLFMLFLDRSTPRVIPGRTPQAVGPRGAADPIPLASVEPARVPNRVVSALVAAADVAEVLAATAGRQGGAGETPAAGAGEPGTSVTTAGRPAGRKPAAGHHKKKPRVREEDKGSSQRRNLHRPRRPPKRHSDRRGKGRATHRHGREVDGKGSASRKEVVARRSSPSHHKRVHRSKAKVGRTRPRIQRTRAKDHRRHEARKRHHHGGRRSTPSRWRPGKDGRLEPQK